MVKKIWDKDTVFEDAKKYQSKSDWRQASPSAYTICSRNGWITEACLHMVPKKRPNGYWTRDRLQAESKKYKTTGEWNRADPSSYSVAKKHGLIPSTLARELIHGQWTKPMVEKVASKFKTRGEFRVAQPSAYTIAATNGWLDEVCAHMLSSAPWFGPRIIREFLMRHDIDHEIEKKFRSLPDIARFPFDFFLPDFNLVIEYHGRQHREGWFGDKQNARQIQLRDSQKKKGALKADLNYLQIDALSKEPILRALMSRLREIRKLEGKKFILKPRELTPTEIKSLESAFIWTHESVTNAIGLCQSIKEFRDRFPSGYDYALKHRIWRDLSTPLYRNKDPGKYTKDHVSAMAKQCQTKKEFRELHRGCWAAAQRNGWLQEICAHMPKHLQRTGENPRRRQNPSQGSYST